MLNDPFKLGMVAQGLLCLEEECACKVPRNNRFSVNINYWKIRAISCVVVWDPFGSLCSESRRGRCISGRRDSPYWIYR